MKAYAIGEKEFELKKLNWKQRSLTRGFYSKFFTKWFESLSALDAVKKTIGNEQPLDASMQKSVTVSMEMNDILYGGEDVPTFLATILTPGGATWNEGMIEENKATMEAIDDDVLREVLGDFFTLSLQLKNGSPRFSPGLQRKKSESNEEQKPPATEVAKDTSLNSTATS